MLALWRFVATKIFLGFCENDNLAKFGAVLFEAEFLRSVHGVFGRVINTLTTLFREHTDNFALVAFFGHEFYTFA